MRVGFIGCGKLGLMVALTIESKGHQVRGYDINPAVAGYLKDRKIPFREEGADTLLANTAMQMFDLDELVAWADILFMAPQTPHGEEYEGSTRVPETRADFDYTFLKQAVVDICAVLDKPKPVVIISTVLPGTIERDVRPLLTPNFQLIYEPLFIAMGSVYNDYLNPEFVLVGVDNPDDAKPLESFYKTIHQKPLLITDVTTAEAIKVSYNTFITTKTVLANLWGQIAEKTGANVDDIYKAWSMATDRLISPRYLQAGMSDGGGCHPRDNIALSYISDELGLSYNFFEFLMQARESHEEWIADYVLNLNIPQPILILGKSFKPETNIITGSPAMLLASLLEEKGAAFTHYDPYIDEVEPNLDQRLIVVVATKHQVFSTYKFKQGTIVIDPFGIMPDQEGVEVRRLGRR